MKKFAKFFIAKPTAVCLTALLIIVVGFFAIFFMPTALIPDLNAALKVDIECDGMDGESVKELVTTPAETALSALDGVLKLESESTDGLSRISLILTDSDKDGVTAASVWLRLSALPLPKGVNIHVRRGGDEFMTLAVRGNKAAADELALALSRCKGVADVAVEDGFRLGPHSACKISVYVSSVRNCKKLARTLESEISDFSYSAEILYNYCDSVRSGNHLSVLWLILAFVLCSAVLLLQLKKLSAAVGCMAAIAVSVMGALALMWAFSLPLTPFSAAGLTVGMLCGLLVSSTVTRSLGRADSAIGDDICATRTALGTPAAIDCAAVFILTMLPLCFLSDALGSICALFATACLITCLLSLIASLTLTPCLYRLKARLRHDVRHDPAPAKTVTAQELDVDVTDYADKARPDCTIPSLEEISRLDRKAKRAVRRTRFRADRPVARLHALYEKALSKLVPMRILSVIIIAVIAVAALTPTCFFTRVEPLSNSYAGYFTVTLNGYEDAAADIAGAEGVSDVLANTSAGEFCVSTDGKHSAIDCALAVKDILERKGLSFEIALRDDALYPLGSNSSDALKTAWAGISIAALIALLLVYFYFAIRLGGPLKALSLTAAVLPAISGSAVAAVAGLPFGAASILGTLVGCAFSAALSLRVALLAEYAIRENFGSRAASLKASSSVFRYNVYALLAALVVLILLCFGFSSHVLSVCPLGIGALVSAVLGTLSTLFLLPAVFCLVRRTRPLLALEAPVYDLSETGIEVEIAGEKTASNLPAPPKDKPL